MSENSNERCPRSGYGHLFLEVEGPRGTGPIKICDYCGLAIYPTALDKQEGGGHYKDQPIQPVEYSQRNHLGFCEGNVVKYVTRHRQKNGAEDIRKAIHYLELLLELEYSEEQGA